MFGCGVLIAWAGMSIGGFWCFRVSCCLFGLVGPRTRGAPIYSLSSVPGVDLGAAAAIDGWRNGVQS